ncbi:hypothetical protein T4E_8845 [Trichinella pseudospiralis]|uniref:Uncharacterized protein n=1 Tax=Trichinella pseudospiralis TaxID=6337 RepID=A0A0V0XQJ7_TRIPS|nr:hypothetical protein T4E_8845 [Trichinella pseudospiralis]
MKGKEIQREHSVAAVATGTRGRKIGVLNDLKAKRFLKNFYLLITPTQHWRHFLLLKRTRILVLFFQKK